MSKGLRIVVEGLPDGIELSEDLRRQLEAIQAHPEVAGVFVADARGEAEELFVDAKVDLDRGAESPLNDVESEREVKEEVDRIIEVYIDTEATRVNHARQEGIYDALLGLRGSDEELATHFIRERIKEAAQRTDPIWKVRLLVQCINDFDRKYGGEPIQVRFKPFPEVRRALLEYVKNHIEKNPNCLNDRNFQDILAGTTCDIAELQNRFFARHIAQYLLAKERGHNDVNQINLVESGPQEARLEGLPASQYALEMINMFLDKLDREK